MFLAFGDTWKRTKKFLDLPPKVDITGPTCLDVLTSKRNARVLTCHECLVGVCGDCTIKQFETNRGVMICRKCRHSVGTPKSAYEVAGVAEVTRRFLACGFKYR